MEEKCGIQSEPFRQPGAGGLFPPVVSRWMARGVVPCFTAEGCLPQSKAASAAFLSHPTQNPRGEREMRQRRGGGARKMAAGLRLAAWLRSKE
jgi:hypothetical protein